MRFLLMSLAVGLAGAFGGLPAARAETPFYQGKQLVVLVNFAPGGPTDGEGRLLARHLPRLVAGNPTVIVNNMNGARGAVAANWLANAAASDGLIMGYFSGVAALRALGEPVLSDGVARLAFIAAGPGVSVTYARTDLAGGLKKPSDILKKKDFWLGGLAADNDRDVRLRMQFDLLGIRYQYQTGFADTSEARVAFQRGDIQVFLEPLAAYQAFIEPGVVNQGIAMPLWFDPGDDGTTMTRPVEADGLPVLSFTDFLIQEKGGLPTSRLFEAYRFVNQLGTQFQRLLVMAPSTPPAAVEALRSAIGKLAEDVQFRDDAFKSVKLVPGYATGSAIADRFATVIDPAPELLAFLRGYVQKASGDAPKADATKADATKAEAAKAEAPRAESANPDALKGPLHKAESHKGERDKKPAP